MTLGAFSAALGGPHVKVQVVSAEDIGVTALRKAYVVIFTTCCGVFDAVKITTSCGVFY